jgi:S-adenosyl methyltransferase
MTTPTEASEPFVARPARVYKAWLGGKDNCAADRDAAALVVHHRPQAVGFAHGNRRFPARVVRYLERCHGITPLRTRRHTHLPHPMACAVATARSLGSSLMIPGLCAAPAGVLAGPKVRPGT